MAKLLSRIEKPGQGRGDCRRRPAQRKLHASRHRTGRLVCPRNSGPAGSRPRRPIRGRDQPGPQASDPAGPVREVRRQGTRVPRSRRRPNREPAVPAVRDAGCPGECGQAGLARNHGVADSRSRGLAVRQDPEDARDPAAESQPGPRPARNGGTAVPQRPAHGSRSLLRQSRSTGSAAVDPSYDADRAWILFQLGNCLRETDSAKAQEAYMKLVSEYPDSPWTELAKAHGRLLTWYQKSRPGQVATSPQL